MIADLTPGSIGGRYYIVLESTNRTTKAGKPMLDLRLGDRTGDIPAKLWDVGDFKVGQVVVVAGEVAEYKGKLEIHIGKIRLTNEADKFDMADLILSAARPIADMWSDLMDIVTCIGDDYIRRLVRTILQDNAARFQESPAARMIHHAYRGGLLEHVLSMARMAIKVSEHYGVDEDLLVAACVLHDIGKIEELQMVPVPTDTLDGAMLGHITQGLLLVQPYLEDNQPTINRHLLHIIASHHGRKEWGSPVEPMSPEAMAFHLIDMLDSKMAIMHSAINKDKGPEPLTPYCAALETRIYKHG